MMTGKRYLLLGLFVATLTVLLLGSVVPAQADSTNAGTYNFTTLDFQEVYHDPDAFPWKGWFEVTANNNTGSAWGGFSFKIFDIPLPGYNASNAVFCDSSYTLAACSNPTSTSALSGWTIFNSGKDMQLTFSGSVAAGSNVTLKVYTDNSQMPGGHEPFGVAFHPTIVPEPVSSTLFIVGAATLGYRRFRRKA